MLGDPRLGRGARQLEIIDLREAASVAFLVRGGCPTALFVPYDFGSPPVDVAANPAFDLWSSHNLVVGPLARASPMPRIVCRGPGARANRCRRWVKELATAAEFVAAGAGQLQADNQVGDAEAVVAARVDQRSQLVLGR